MKILRNILWGIVIFNVIAVVVSVFGMIHPGFFPDISILKTFDVAFLFYTVFAFTVVNVICAVAVAVLIGYRKAKKYPYEINNIILLMIFILSIPLGIYISQSMIYF